MSLMEPLGLCSRLCFRELHPWRSGFPRAAREHRHSWKDRKSCRFAGTRIEDSPLEPEIQPEDNIRELSPLEGTMPGPGLNDARELS